LDAVFPSGLISALGEVSGMCDQPLREGMELLAREKLGPC
jgi:hypothetical protein